MINKNKLSNFLHWATKISLGLALFSPILMNSLFFFPFIVPKNLLFRLAVEIGFAAYLSLAVINKEYRLKLDKIVLAVFAYFGINVVAAILGINFFSSFWGNYERMSGLFHQLHLLMYFIILVGAIKKKSDWYDLFGFTIFISVLMSFIGFAQFLELPFLLKSSGGSRLAATIGNAIYLAVYLLFHFFFISFFLVEPEKFNFKMFAWCFWIFDAYLIIANFFSRFYSEAEWGMFNFLKIPLISESIKYPIFFTIFVLLQAAIIALWFFREDKKFVRLFLSAILFFEFFIFWQTQTRGAIIGLVAGLIIFGVIFLFLNIEKKYKKIIGVLLGLLLLSPILIFALRNTSFVKNDSTLSRLTTISLSDITTQSRVLTWQASWKGLIENPKKFLIGYGPENYYYVFNKYFPTEIYQDNGSQIWFDRAHNIIFDVAVSTGTLGLASFIVLILLSVWVLLREFKKENSISGVLFVSLIVAYLIQNLFVFDNLNTEVLLYLLFGYIAFLSLNFFEKDDNESDDEENKKSVNFIPIVLILLFLCYGLFINYKTFQANRTLIQGLIAGSGASTYQSENNDYFIKSIAQSPIGRFEAAQQFSTYAIDVSRNTNASTKEILGLSTLAIDELEKVIAQEPLNARYRLWLAMVYNALSPYIENAPLKAIAHLQKTMDLSPTRPQVYFELAQSYALLGQNDKALNYYQKGVSLAPKVIDAHWYLVSFYILTGQFDLAEAEFGAMKDLKWQPGALDYQRLAALYERSKNSDKVVWALGEIIKIEPTIENYGQLASYYAGLGKNKEAETVATEIAQKFPEARPQVSEFLDNLKKGELKK